MPFKFVCESCGEEFERHKRLEKGKPFRFCSHECWVAWMRVPGNSPLSGKKGPAHPRSRIVGELHHAYKGGCLRPDGYWYLPEKGNRVLKHRKIFSEAIARELLSGEIVHHEDRDRSNDDPRNLRLFKTHAAHRCYHAGTGPRGMTYEEVLAESLAPD